MIFLVPLIPLFVTTSSIFPYITGKNFAFRILVEFAAVLWLGLISTNKEYRPGGSPVTLSILFFTCVVGFADLLGVSSYNSFWSNYERMEGYVTILHLALYYVIIKSVLRTKKEWKIFFNIFVIAGTCVSVYALSLPVVPPNSSLFSVIYSSRLYGTVGNPPFLASYLLLTVFFGAILIFHMQRHYLKFVYLVLIAINLIAIYFTASRGAILAAAIGTIMLIMFHILAKSISPDKKRARQVVISVIALLILISAALVSFKNAELVKHNRTLSRFATMFSDDSVQNRFMAWKYAWEGVKERPVLGWGQENFIGVYTVNPIPFIHEQIWFDRAHNIVIDWLVNAGFLGLLSYLAIFGTAFFVLRASLRKKSVSKNESMMIMTALTAYFIQNLFTFDTINSYILFFTLLAYIDNIDSTNVATNPNKSVDPEKAIIKSIYVTLPALLLFSIVCYHVNYKPYKESRFIQTINSSGKDNSYSNILNEFNTILSLKTFGDDTVRKVMSATSFTILESNSLKQPGALDFIEKTVEELEKGIGRNRYNLEYLTDVISLYNQVSRHEPSFIDHTESLIRACINLNPGYERLYFMLAYTLVLKKDYEEAIEIASKIAVQVPVNEAKYLELTLIAILSSRDDIASGALENLKAIRMSRHDYSSFPGNIFLLELGELRRVAQMYLESNRYYDAIHYYQQAIASLPENSPVAAPIHYKMANIYLTIGDTTNAVNELNKAAAIDPERFTLKAVN